MITILTSVVRPSPADDSRESGEGLDCKLYIIIQFLDVAWYSVVYISLQYQYIAMLHSSIGIGIARGQYHRILVALFGIVLTLLVISAQNVSLCAHHAQCFNAVHGVLTE